MKFIKGKWYKNVGAFNSFAKFDSFYEGNEKKFGHYENIHEGNKYNKYDILHNYSIMSDIEEATLDEIREFLPDGHPDKIQPVIQEENYKYLEKLLKKLELK